MASMIAGSLVAIGSMIAYGLDANEPIFFGLGAGLVVYLAVSLATRPTSPEVLDAWSRRLAGEPSAGSDDPVPTA